MIEKFLDRVFGKKVRKGLEQVAHALMSGGPAAIVAFEVKMAGLSHGLSIFLGVVAGTVGLPYLFGFMREVTQNWGDEPDETTLFRISKLPVNGDMMQDMSAYAIGSLFFSCLAVFAATDPLFS